MGGKTFALNMQERETSQPHLPPPLPAKVPNALAFVGVCACVCLDSECEREIERERT